MWGTQRNTWIHLINRWPAAKINIHKSTKESNPESLPAYRTKGHVYSPFVRITKKVFSGSQTHGGEESTENLNTQSESSKTDPSHYCDHHCRHQNCTPGSRSIFRLCSSLEFVNFYMDYGYFILIQSMNIFKYKTQGWSNSRYKTTSLRYWLCKDAFKLLMLNQNSATKHLSRLPTS